MDHPLFFNYPTPFSQTEIPLQKIIRGDFFFMKRMCAVLKTPETFLKIQVLENIESLALSGIKYGILVSS